MAVGKAIGTAVKASLGDDAVRYAGQELSTNIGGLLGGIKRLTTEGTRSGMKAIRKGLGIKYQSGVAPLLREGTRNNPGAIPELVGSGAALFTAGKGIQGGMNMVGSMMGTNNQQSKYSQPMTSGMEKFLYDQELQNLKFQNQLGLMLAKAEATNPGVQYKNMAEAEKTLSEAGEITNAEVLQVARSIYGTGLRV